MFKVLMDNINKDDHYASTFSNINSSTNSITPSPPSTPSGPATPEAVRAQSRLYRARLIVENHLYDELLNRYQLATTRVKEVTREANALEEENEWLRLANDDLTRRLHSLLSFSDQSVGLTAGSSSTSGRNNNGESVGSSSPMSVADEGEERVSLPKSISVRSPGYFKLANLPPPTTAFNQCGIAPSQRPNKARLRLRKEEKAIEVEAYRQGMYKTELCNKWQETGSCPYGQQCQFAHGLSELRPVVRHPRYKTQVCRMVLTGAACPYGHRCHFLHSFPTTNRSNTTS